jgi:hypothetical protein
MLKLRNARDSRNFDYNSLFRKKAHPAEGRHWSDDHPRDGRLLQGWAMPEVGNAGDGR